MMFPVLILMVAAVEQCGVCHPDVRVQHQASIHHRESVGCTDCHGGDASALSVERAHRGSFRRGLRRRDIPALCAECHSKLELMRPYNLPADQYLLYQSSQHGQALARGDERAAVCTDCHRTHDILSRTDPGSTVFLTNIPETCGQCHGDPNFMGRYGKSADAVQQYMQSVHGIELMEKGNTHAPECSRCHGVHGAAPPGSGDVSKVCGTCHTSALLAFRSGPHSAVLGEASGMGECAACHDNHNVQPAERGDVAQVCRDCHEPGSAGIDVANKIAVLLARAQEETERARLKIEEAAAVPLYVDDYLARLEVARTHLLEAEPAIHSVTLETVEGFTRPARSIGEEIQSEIQGKLSDLSLRRIGLLIFWFYVLITIWLLMRYRQMIPGERG